MLSKKYLIPLNVLTYTVCYMFLLVDFSHSATLQFKPEQSSSKLHFTLALDKVDKLAGLKISLTYPKTSLKFLEAKKLKTTASFLHVVNDKTPGKLIIVMASAKGISGTNIALIDLAFSLSTKNKPPPVTITTQQCQLMTEGLKKVPCNFIPFTFHAQGTSH